jgi:hypothetical protein
LPFEKGVLLFEKGVLPFQKGVLAFEKGVLAYVKGVLAFNSDSNLGAFDILIYTDKDQDVPEKWEESGPQFIANSQEVRLRSFSTVIHKVNAMVAYKN